MSEQVNIEKIMAEIRAEIQEKGISLNLPDFSGASEKPVLEIRPFDMQEFRQNVLAVERSYQVECYAPIVGNPIIKVFKRIVRKLVNFIVSPIVEDQNAFNSATARTISSLQSYIHELEKRIKELEVAGVKGDKE